MIDEGTLEELDYSLKERKRDRKMRKRGLMERHGKRRSRGTRENESERKRVRKRN